MVLRGFAKGRRIELEESLPYADGQPLNVTVEAAGEELPLGSPASILEALAQMPKLTPADVDELDLQIKAGRVPVRDGGVFDSDR